MANTVIHKQSAVAGKVPTTAQFAQGELALNTTDKKLYAHDGTTVFNMASRWSDETGGISRADRVKVGSAGAPASALDIAGTASFNAAVTTGAMDLLVASRFTITVTADTTFSFVNPPATRAAEVILRITNGGLFALTFPASVSWEGGSTPTFATAGTDVVIFITHDGGTTWRASAVLANAASSGSIFPAGFNPLTDLAVNIPLGDGLHIMPYGVPTGTFSFTATMYRMRWANSATDAAGTLLTGTMLGSFHSTGATTGGGMGMLHDIRFYKRAGGGYLGAATGTDGTGMQTSTTATHVRIEVSTLVWGGSFPGNPWNSLGIIR
jgi:hypothetical protein